MMRETATNHRKWMMIDPQAGSEFGRSGSGAAAHSAGRSLRVVIAGGGTGGHLFPGIAVAEEFLSTFPDARILFINTGNPLEKSALSAAGFSQASIQAEGLKNRGKWRQLVATVKIPLAVVASWRILGRMNPQVVIGVGGYSSGPVALAAWFRGIPVVLHEQNRLPGLTNRLLGRLAERVYLSFEDSASHFPEAKCLVTGNPVRGGFLQDTEKAPPASGLRETVEKRPLTVLVTGGSQGAHAINTAVTGALEHLGNIVDFRFIHQTGKADEAMVSQAYARRGVSGTVSAFIQNMAAAYGEADLVVCRAGATTVAEITVMKKVALFIPFPHAADDHQTVNARALAEAGAAEMIAEKDLDGKRLAERLRYFAANRTVLTAMGEKAGEFGRPDAAGTIVADCCRMLFGMGKDGGASAAGRPRKGDR